VALTISRPIRIFALVALVAAIGGVAMLAMKPKQSAAPPVVVSKSKPTATTAVKPAPSPKAATKTPVGPKTAAATPATKPSPVAIPPARKDLPVGANGLPKSIDAALAKHRIVVVSVFDPQASTDAISYSEAKAGAADAGVGFVAISLLDSPVAAALTSALPGGGLLPAPGLLIYRKPGVLVQRIDGFADRDVVAQAAAASASARPITGVAGS
jgi:hypothetical protein